jgi:hypothetical protein
MITEKLRSEKAYLKSINSKIEPKEDRKMTFAIDGEA